MAAMSHLIVAVMVVSFSMNLISAFRHLSQTHATDTVNNFQENSFSVELENDSDYIGYRFKDSSDGIAPSGSREQATESPRDIVDSFLSKVEEYERNKENCTPGTTFNLGEGVVAQYGVRRFRRQAMAAVERANFLTRIWKNRTPEQGAPLDSDYFFYSAVRTMVEGDDDLFAAGNCYDFREYKNRTLWCAYAYRLPSNRVMVKDLSVEYKYLGNDSEFFYEARRKAAAKLERGYNVSIGYSMYRHNDTGHLETTIEDSIVIEYEDGHWSKPYFDCKGGDIWMMTYTVPFFGFVNHTYYFKGTSGIDIDLQKVDIDQCDLPSNSPQLNVFAGTHKCKHPTTKCVPVDGLGFRRGSYRCVCQSGYYFPNTSLPKELRYFDGTGIEKQYDQMLQGKTNDYYLFYACLPCMPGCSTCVDGSPCVLSLDWILRGIVLALTCLVICFIPALVWLTYNFKHVKVIKAASPVLLRIVLLGAFLLYCPMIVQYFEPTAIHCSMRIWLRELGFSISYGALLLKTWRISVAFRIRSAQKIRISDVDLIKRLLIIVGVFAVFLMIRMIVAAPQVVRGTHSSGLHTFQCSWDSWDYCAAVAELGLLVWGVRLCIMVRKAPFEFNESRFISWAIYNETLLSLFLNITIVFLQSSSNPDLLYLVLFFYTQLTTTVTLAILFGSKIYFVYKSKMSKTGEQSTTSSNSTTKYLVVPKTDASRSSCIRLHEGQMNLDGEGEIQLDKDIQDELRRLYTQLELLRQRNMRMGNPHLNFKSSTVYNDKSKDLLRQTSEIALLSRDVSQSSSLLYKHYGTIGQDNLSRDLNVTFSLRCDGKKDDHVICTSL